MTLSFWGEGAKKKIENQNPPHLVSKRCSLEISHLENHNGIIYFPLYTFNGVGEINVGNVSDRDALPTLKKSLQYFYNDSCSHNNKPYGRQSKKYDGRLVVNNEPIEVYW